MSFQIGPKLSKRALKNIWDKVFKNGQVKFVEDNLLKFEVLWSA